MIWSASNNASQLVLLTECMIYITPGNTLWGLTWRNGVHYAMRFVVIVLVHMPKNQVTLWPSRCPNNYLVESTIIKTFVSSKQLNVININSYKIISISSCFFLFHSILARNELNLVNWNPFVPKLLDSLKTLLHWPLSNLLCSSPRDRLTMTL